MAFLAWLQTALLFQLVACSLNLLKLLDIKKKFNMPLFPYSPSSASWPVFTAIFHSTQARFFFSSSKFFYHTHKKTMLRDF